MTVIHRLASPLGRRDEAPNQELAGEIVRNNDHAAISELVGLLHHKNKDLQSDSIKVLYEIGRQKPGMIAACAPDFIALLKNKNNRLQWGAMTALDSITLHAHEAIYSALPEIMAAADKGSVITRDHAVGILTKLYTIDKYSDDMFALFSEQLKKSPVNQLPMYAENALPAIREKDKAAFVKILTSRLVEMDKESKKKRIEKVIHKLSTRK